VPGSDEQSFRDIKETIRRTARLEFKMLDDETDFFAKVKEDELPTGGSLFNEEAPAGVGNRGFVGSPGAETFATSDAYVAPCSVTETYGILTSGRPIRNRKLTRAGAKNQSSKESIMLDVAFVVLGLAVLALMGAYAVGLRQL